MLQNHKFEEFEVDLVFDIFDGRKRFEGYVDLLLEENERINLVSRETIILGKNLIYFLLDFHNLLGSYLNFNCLALCSAHYWMKHYLCVWESESFSFRSCSKKYSSHRCRYTNTNC